MGTNPVQPLHDRSLIQYPGPGRELNFFCRSFKFQGRIVERLELNIGVFPAFKFHHALAHTKRRGGMFFISGIEIRSGLRHGERVLRAAQTPSRMRLEVPAGKRIHRLRRTSSRYTGSASRNRPPRTAATLRTNHRPIAKYLSGLTSGVMTGAKRRPRS